MADDRERAAREQQAKLVREETWTPPTSGIPVLTVGTVVGGQYEIMGPGLPGGMGVVYPALDRQLEERVALKVMHPRLVTSESLVKQFRDEARNGMRLRHEGVVAVRHFGEWAAQKYFVMEWVGGGSLRAELSRRRGGAGERVRLPWREAVSLVRRITEALAHAHGKEIVHLDLKPENVLLEPGPDGAGDLRRPRLADFGLSKLLGKEALQRSAAAAGTAGYMAPERLEGRFPDPRMDVFSVGVILYELLCGRLPVGRFKLPHEADPSTPEPLDAIIDQCLESEPEGRYQSAEELCAALRTAVTGDVRSVATVTIRAIQEALKDRGYDPGPIDGKMGPRTRAALRYYQRAENLDVSGRIDLATVDKLGVTTPSALLRLPTSTSTRQPSAVNSPVLAERRPGVDPSEMIVIPAGEFWMGSTEDDAGGFTRENPRHQVFVDAFEIDKDPVTNARWKRFMDAGGYREQGYWAREGWKWRTESTVTEPGAWRNDKFNAPDQPVVGVSWYEAEAFCTWTGKRLPTEAEWEKAARGADGRKYPWGNEWDPARANSKESKIEKTTPVGQYPQGASPYGVRDMVGNVWEWVADWHDNNYYKQSPRRNPKGPEMGDHRVLRGGSWFINPHNLRAAFRDLNSPGNRNPDVGFRCARGASGS